MLFKWLVSGFNGLKLLENIYFGLVLICRLVASINVLVCYHWVTFAVKVSKEGKIDVLIFALRIQGAEVTFS